MYIFSAFFYKKKKICISYYYSNNTRIIAGRILFSQSKNNMPVSKLFESMH